MSSPTETSGGQQLGRAVRKARRSSSALRGLGLVAGLAAAALLGVFLYQSGALLPSAPAKTDAPPVVEFPDQVSGNNATITGRDRNQRPFEIKAAKGQQDKSIKTLVHLQEVTGNFERPSGSQMNITADTGQYDTSTKTFHLEGGVTFVEPSRMKATMDAADINTNDQTLTSSGPVQVEMRGTSIQAGNLTVNESGSHIVFKGGVKARFVTKAAPTGEGG